MINLNPAIATDEKKDLLRDYQRRALEELYQWVRKYPGNPCLVLPTGSGKSHLVAALCKEAVQGVPGTRILMLTHVKELIQQNSEKMREHWPNAPMGLYSASLRRRELGQPITFGGIQSLAGKAEQIGFISIVIVDESHLINHKDEGQYRKLINDLKETNPALRVIGLTASPYRLGHGLITEGSAIFDDLIEPVSIEELVYKKYLSHLKSKKTNTKLDTSGVHRRGGDFIRKELAEAVDKDEQNEKIVVETIAHAEAEGRAHWLFFCAGIDHAKHMRDTLREYGVTAETVTGKTPKAKREDILARYKAGEITALTNVDVLTTGFDYPDIDLIIFARPTESPGLYLQMAGRGMRLKSHTDYCRILDFAGLVSFHGPVTAIEPPQGVGEGKGEAPVKECGNCHELVHASLKVCPECGEAFPPPPPKPVKLHDDDIMGAEPSELGVLAWSWKKHVSRTSGKEMLRVRYSGALQKIDEFFPVTHGGYAGEKAVRTVADIAIKAGVDWKSIKSLNDAPEAFNSGNPPEKILFKKSGRFYNVIERSWK